MIIQERRLLYHHPYGSQVSIVASPELCNFLGDKPFRTLWELDFVGKVEELLAVVRFSLTTP